MRGHQANPPVDANGTRNRRSVRLKAFDYSSPGAYFVTIVTQGRAVLFGAVVRRTDAALTGLVRGRPLLGARSRTHFPSCRIGCLRRNAQPCAWNPDPARNLICPRRGARSCAQNRGPRSGAPWCAPTYRRGHSAGGSGFPRRHRPAIQIIGNAADHPVIRRSAALVAAQLLRTRHSRRGRLGPASPLHRRQPDELG